VAERISRFHAELRPVLVGTDSVADSETLSQRLRARGIAHEVLNARNDSVEAAIIARAGSAGAVTVSTNMAGRGTDIVLASDVAARGGLHVMCCQHNGARRLDRQIEGRAARQGDPGSVETWLALDAGLFRRGGWLGALARRLAGPHKNGSLPWPLQMVRAMVRWPQLMQERRDAAQRRRLALHDREWDRRATFAPPVE
jgi:preprotein translocase subunit SecA